MSSKVRVRFAPSPTGPLHIGGLRTALYNYLFAKKHHGDFILRIEDTDQKRLVKGAEDYVIEALNWCHIPYDEGPLKEGGFGPYKQSERKTIYKEYIGQLLESGHAYYAFDSSEELNQLRKSYEAEGEIFSYNWKTRDTLQNSITLSKEEVQKKLDSGEKHVIRFKPPREEELLMEDLVRGKIKVSTEVVDDKVLFKSDGLPTYHLANIIDDHLMKISHVIRGEEWLPSLALHILLYRAFGWEAPKFAHLPLILKPAGKGKLSKRDGDKLGFPVFPLEWKNPSTKEVAAGYREDGYLPEAVINMLAFLGWNPGQGSEQEIFSLEELVQAFSLEKVSKSGARFDPEKTKWFQHHYFQQEDNLKLAEIYRKKLQKKGIEVSIAYAEKVVNAIKERASFVKDFWDLSYFYFKAPKEFDQKSVKKAWKEQTSKIISQVDEIICNTEDFTPDKLQTEIKGWIKSNEVGFGKVMMPLRLAIVGKMMGPDLFEIMTTLGKEETSTRLKYAIDKLG